jgi:hypothetical protein
MRIREVLPVDEKDIHAEESKMDPALHSARSYSFPSE